MERKPHSFTLAKRRKWAKFEAKHPELVQRMKAMKKHAYNINREHGLSRVDYEYFVRVQGGRCAICRRRPEDVKQRVLAVDHCHVSGRMRGLLCRDCNWMLGRIKEDPLIARALVAYIENRCEPSRGARL